MVVEKKRCSKCKVTKPASEFNRHSKRKDGLQNYCKGCSRAAWKRDYHQKDHYLNVIIKNRYGLSRREYEEMLASQGGGCGICGTTDRLVVDHDHESGRVRGILCTSCNVSLGRLNEDVGVLRRMIDYLEQ